MDATLKSFSPRVTREAAVSWFHGKLTRDAAEHVLKIHGQAEGLYLVRDSNTSPGDYVLTVVHETRYIHYQIRRHGEDAFFSIDDGPILHGLETLIEYYQQGGRGLVSQLGPMCPGQLPPPDTLCHGRSNLLHRAILGGDHVVVGELLKSGYHSLDAKNQDGQTAVHLSISEEHTHILRLLLESGANANIKELRGLTPLHYASSRNLSDACRHLLHLGKANPQLRATSTGWVAMHEAAFRGHAEVIKVLLEFGAPCHPRSYDNLTPLDLAIEEKHLQCQQILESFEPSVPKMDRSCWFHDAMERQRSTLLLEQHGKTDGLFLIRKSVRNPANHVISMVNATHIYQFEIRKKDRFYFIDDGPYLSSLEHVVDHYSRLSDGLPTRLVKPVVPARSEHLRKSSRDDGLSSSLGNKVPQIFLGPNLIRRETLTLGETIGEGEYGSVLKGTCFAGPGKIQTEVAIKMLHEDHVQQSRDEFVREVEVMSTLRHPCIVHLVGVCLGPPLMMITELVSMGSLLDYLLDAYSELPSLSLWDTSLRLWASQIASGMAYLEGKRFVHRDLAARNILLASKEQIKISDFGLSRVLGAGSEYYKATSGGRWPVKWYAPESVNFGSFSHASDVWSYGVTLWEMFTFGGQPYGDLNGLEVMELIEAGERLPRPRDCSQDVFDTMMRCWSYKPDKRPTFSGLHQHFLGNKDLGSILVTSSSAAVVRQIDEDGEKKEAQEQKEVQEQTKVKERKKSIEQKEAREQNEAGEQKAREQEEAECDVSPLLNDNFYNNVENVTQQ